jgi:hypothetical protein
MGEECIIFQDDWLMNGWYYWKKRQCDTRLFVRHGQPQAYNGQ